MMKLMLLLLAAAAVKAKPSSDEVFAVKLQRDQTLHSFSWTAYDQEVDERATLRVCFFWNETGTETSLPSLPFDLTYNNENRTEFSVMSDEPVQLETGVFCGNAPVDPSTLSYSTPQVYLVHSQEVSAGAMFIMYVSPGTLEAEDLTAANVTRVTGMTDYALQDCTADGDTSCIFAPIASLVELCTLSQDTSEGGGESILVCDSTFGVTQVTAQTNGTKSVVLFDNDNYSVEVTTEVTSTVHALISDASDGNDMLSCSGSSCPAFASPGTFLYSVVVIEVNETTNKATSSDKVTVQDLDLTVVSTDQVIDFHFENMHGERMYEVFSTNKTAETVFDSQLITLDCTGVPAQVPCYAFVSSDHSPAYVAVRYSDGTNGVVSKINYE